MNRTPLPLETNPNLRSLVIIYGVIFLALLQKQNLFSKMYQLLALIFFLPSNLNCLNTLLPVFITFSFGIFLDFNITILCVCKKINLGKFDSLKSKLTEKVLKMRHFFIKICLHDYKNCFLFQY